MCPLERRRSGIEVIGDILRLLRLGPAGKAEIMAVCNLSYHQLNNHLNSLNRSGLLHEVIRDRQTVNYQVSSKGLQVLTQIELIQEMLHGPETINILQAPTLDLNTGRQPARIKSSK